MNRFLDRLAELYAPLGRRGLLMDGLYRFAPDEPSHLTTRTAPTAGADPVRDSFSPGPPAHGSNGVARRARSYGSMSADGLQAYGGSQPCWRSRPTTRIHLAIPTHDKGIFIA
jgi:hypothetical protein